MSELTFAIIKLKIINKHCKRGFGLMTDDSAGSLVPLWPMVTALHK